MALALENELRTMNVKVARGHRDERLKDDSCFAIEKFVSGQYVFVSLPTGFEKSLIYGLQPTVFNRLKGHTAPTSIALIDCQAHSALLNQQARCVHSPMTCYNFNSLHLTLKSCGCEIITFTPCNECGRNQYCIGKLPDPFLCSVAQ